MFQSIKNCLNQPDEISKHGKRFEYVKRFPYNIGVMGYTNQSSKSVKDNVYQDKKDGFCYHSFPNIVVKQNMHEHVVGL